MSSAPKRVDASWLPPEVRTDGDFGVIASFYPDGQLRELRCEVWGVTVGEKLSLGQGTESGSASLGLESASIYRDGAAEQFDAWSDNLRPVPEDWEQWVRKHITKICQTGQRLGQPPPLLDAVWLLFNAADRKAHTCLAALLRMGLSPELAIEDGRKPLHAATTAEAARLLLDAGAPINDLGWAGITPLLHCMRWQGQDPRCMEKRDFPDWVSELGPVIDLLLARGADPDLTANYRGSCVHQAAEAPGPSNLERVLPYSRNPLARNKAGETPLDSARAWGRALNVQRLEREVEARRGAMTPPPPPFEEAAPRPEGGTEQRGSGGLLAAFRRWLGSGPRPRR